MEPFIGQVALFAGNFAPVNWAFCDGNLLSVSEHQSLFSILGTTYGGDGRTTFALPDLRGRVPIGEGTGTGLSGRSLGAHVGSETVTLAETQIPAHTHVASVNATTGTGTSTSPHDHYMAHHSDDVNAYSPSKDTTMKADAVVNANTGGGQGHNNMQPSLAINYIICLVGLYPSRN